MSENISLVATYANHGLAKNTARKLKVSGFDVSKLSIFSNDKNDSVDELGGATVLNRMEALNEARYTCIPQDRINDYEAELKADRLLIVAHGTADEIAQAKRIIDATHPESWDGKVDCTIYYGCVD